jgi:hypothetical protein
MFGAKLPWGITTPLNCFFKTIIFKNVDIIEYFFSDHVKYYSFVGVIFNTVGSNI